MSYPGIDYSFQEEDTSINRPSPISIETGIRTPCSPDDRRRDLVTPHLPIENDQPSSPDSGSPSGKEGSPLIGTAEPVENILLMPSVSHPCAENQTSSPTQISPLECERLLFLAEPNENFRFRYESEINRADQYQRYLRTKAGSSKYIHPTITIPPKWLDPYHAYYIRVNLITIPMKTNKIYYIHPYKITSQEKDVRKNETNDTLYFPITPNDRLTGEKTFLICLIKSLQSDLKHLTHFRQFDTNQYDRLQVQNHQHSKELISVYHLNKCQLVFTVVEFDSNSLYSSEPIYIFYNTLLFSPVLKDTHGDDSDPLSDEFKQILCIPQCGRWLGKENCVIIMPYLIKKKRYIINFIIEGFQPILIEKINAIDTKTLLFEIPQCPIPEADENKCVWLVLFENEIQIKTIPFTYLTSFKTIITVSTPYDANGFGEDETNNKRMKISNDSADWLVSQIEQITIEEQPQSHDPFLEYQRSVDKYMHQLKDALNIFVRTNNPSQLFRRTRALITKGLEGTLLLHGAVENGQTETIVSLIEQIIDLPTSNILFEEMNEYGETPLLVAAKLNQGQIIEYILKKRSEYAKQKDKNENNLLHLLASLKDNEGVDTIEKILLVLSDDLAIHLLKDKNDDDKTPLNIAQLNGNKKIENLFAPSDNEEDSK